MTVAVVGAGIGGLSLVHYLAALDVDAVVLEATAEPGGVVRSARIEGQVVERGPQRTRLTPAVRALVADVGLSDSVVEAADVPLYVYRDGGLGRVPTTLAEARQTDLLTPREKLRALLEPLADPPQSGETVRTYLARAFGPAVAEVVGSIYGGLYGTDPAEMPMDRTLGRALDAAGVSGSVLIAAIRWSLRRRATPPAVTFEGGMGTLPRALADRHRDCLRFSTPVRGIQRAGDRYRVTTDGATVRVDDVVITTPAGVAAALVDGIDPPSAAALRRLRYHPLAVVTLESDADLHGAGYQVPVGEPLATLGSTWNHSLLGQPGRYTCYLGGGKDPALVDQSDEALGTIAADEFETVTGHPATPIDVSRVSPGMPAFDTTWAAVDAVDPPDGLHFCTNYLARAGIPGRVAEARSLARRLADRHAPRRARQGAADQAAGIGPS